MRYIAIFICLSMLFFVLEADPIQLEEVAANQLIINFELPDYEISGGIARRDNYQTIEAPGSLIHLESGYPQIPYYSGSLGLPIDGDFYIQIIDYDQTMLRNINLRPTDSFLEDSVNKESVSYKNPSVYQKDALYPSRLVEKGSTAYHRDRYFAGFVINPFQYNPVRNELVITHNLTLRINIIGDTTSKTRRASSESFIDKAASEFILNNTHSQHWRKERVPLTNLNYRSPNTIEEIQIVVDSEGIYQVSYEDLIEALQDYEYSLAFDWDNLDPRYFELSSQDGIVPIHFSGENNHSFDPGDYFEFWGVPNYGEETYYDAYTAENVYTLKLNNHLGSRLAVANGGLQVSDPTQYIVPSSYKHTVHLEEQRTRNHLGAQVYYDPDFYREDIWFWQRVDAPSMRAVPFELEYPMPSDIKSADVKVSLWGATYTRLPGSQWPNTNILDHHALVYVNDALINNHMWNGQREKIFTNTQPVINSVLNHGSNNLYITLPGIQGIENEQVLLDYIEISYWREYKTDNDMIKFSKPQDMPNGLYQFELENFTESEISVYVLGNSILENVQIEPSSELIGTFEVAFQHEVFTDDIRFYAVGENSKKSPLEIRAKTPSNLHYTGNQADYIIITSNDFIDNEGTQLFKSIWEQQGYAVKLVNQQHIFDEFSDGIRSAQAIKDFLSYAYHNWQEPALTHVMLLGDGLTDERDDSSNRPYNIIPFRNVWFERRGATASDNWYGCIVGEDPVPDIVIARLPIWREEQIIEVANKTLQYLENPNYDDLWHSKITLVGGGKPHEGSFFSKQNERIRAGHIPQFYHINRVYGNVEDLPDGYHGTTIDLKNYINEGTKYLQFIGHGGGYIWGDYNLLNRDDISTLMNQNFPFVASLSCFASAFNNRGSTSIGEEFVITPNRGAIAHIGFTGYGYKYADEYYGMYLNDGIFKENVRTVGEIVDFAKTRFFLAATSSNIKTALIHGSALLGDPMIKLFCPPKDTQIELSDYNLSEGDSLHIQAEVGDQITHGVFRIYDEDEILLPEYQPITIPAIENQITSPPFIIPSSPDSIYAHTVKLFAYGHNTSSIGMTNYAVGQSAMVNLQIIPETPTESDSIMIKADFFAEEGIQSVTCHIAPQSTISMSNISGHTYSLDNYIQPHNAGNVIKFHFEIVDQLGNITLTNEKTITISGPDLALQSIELVEKNNLPAIKMKVRNIGSIASGSCFLRIFDTLTSPPVLIDSTEVEPVESMAYRFEHVFIPLLNGEYRFRATINPGGESFSEYTYANNSITSEQYEINMYAVGDSLVTGTSLDGNLACTFPPDLNYQPSIFYINSLGNLESEYQPDIKPITLKNGMLSQAYEIGTLNPEVLSDSLGHFQNKTVTLEFHYSEQDSTTLAWQDDGRFAVYRWQPEFEKWIFQGGYTDVDDKIIVYEAQKTGIYSVFYNDDHTKPTVSLNVEGQEFTHGGYIAGDGTISIILKDENGIDLFDNVPELYLEGQLIKQENYSIAITSDNLIHVPIKYKLENLSEGNYTLEIECHDLNSNHVSHSLDFRVSAKFDIINLANYPNPISLNTENPVNRGRTRFTYVLTDNADKVDLKIYTVSGRLVKKFSNLSSSVGYHEFPRSVHGWDCRDEEGYLLANGVYFYRITAKKGNKTIEKTGKMAIIK